ncbi:hypothetical protein C2U63_16380 [Burkholderia pseudomallei]|nr:hypothetical protein C2U63_16380 [Burkholderia pseudomallei]
MAHGDDRALNADGTRGRRARSRVRRRSRPRAVLFESPKAFEAFDPAVHTGGERARTRRTAAFTRVSYGLPCKDLLQPFAWNDGRDLLFWRIYEIRRARRGVRRLIRGGHA